MASTPASSPVATQVAPGVHRFDDGIVNWYLLEEDGAFTAVDAGFPPAWAVLNTALGMLGAGVSALRAVVVTHAHLDHLGFAERARRAGATIYVSEADEELLHRPLRLAKSERSPAGYLGRRATRELMVHVLRTGSPFGPRPAAATTFAGGETLPVPGSPRAIACPGHTFGHHAFHLPDRDVLFTGDALVTRDPYTGETGPRIVAAAATADVAQSLRSLDPLGATGAGLVLPGHGDPWEGGSAEAAARARAAGPA